MVIEVERGGGGGLVEVDGGEDEVRDRRRLRVLGGEEGEEGDGLVGVVVGLLVEDDPGFGLGRGGQWRHGGEVFWGLVTPN